MHVATENDEPVGKIRNRFRLDRTLPSAFVRLNSVCWAAEIEMSTSITMTPITSAFDTILSLGNVERKLLDM